MPAPALVLFDDEQARLWEPFALTRPSGELRFGAWRLVERAERAFGLPCIGHLTAEHLTEFVEPGARPVLRPQDLPHDRDLVFLCSRAAIEPDERLARPTDRVVYTVGGQPAGLALPAGQRPGEEFLMRLQPPNYAADRIDARGRILEWVWDLVVETPDQLARDLAAAGAKTVASLPAAVNRLGDEALILGHDVRIEPGVLFDTRDAPIMLGDRVEVRAGTRLAGPAAIGEHSRLLGGSFEALSAGPYSYLHGEIGETVTLGHVNKAHDGYLGHAYLGRWVNLGALTTNSDLKNNYRSVKMWTPLGVRDTGALKLGCLLGDHAKTGIGLLLSTGTVVGAGANIYGSVMPPQFVPPFSWGEGDRLGEYRLAEFLETAKTVMARRGVELDERGRRYLESCWRRGRGE